MIRVAIVDDHPHVAIALRALLERTADIRLVAEARRGLEVADLVQRERPRVLLLDLVLEPRFDAVSAVRALRARFPELRICIFSAHVEPIYVRNLLQAGACGYILKDDDYVSQIESIIRDLAAGRTYLSPQAQDALVQATQQVGDRELLTERERDILRLAQRGLPNPQIGQALHITPGTVRNHLSAIYRKLGVHSRHEALAEAEERGLI
jgi:DNA-binding NarL/FixJ family response regulator